MAKSKLDSFLNKLRQKTGSSSISESRYGSVSNWISTGSLALNRILSGSIKRGIPSGRVVVIGGQSSTGKSLLAALIMSNALKSGYDMIFYFDSEGGGSKDFFENTGCDTSKIQQILVSSIEDAQIKILQTYNMIMEIKKDEPERKFLCVLDSLGALVADKVLRDADKGKVASEMGGRAKQCLFGDTLILMEDKSFKQIKDVKPGDKVITHLNKIKTVQNNFSSHHNKYIKLTVNNEVIKMSLNHKLLISRDNNLIFCEAQYIKKTDKIIFLNSEQK